MNRFDKLTTRKILRVLFLICLFLSSFSRPAMACQNCPSCYTWDGEHCVWAGGPPPATPTNLDANAVDCNEIKLTWTDNADNETCYTVGRSANGVNFDWIATTGSFSGTGTYSDTNGTAGLEPNTLYYYRVLRT